MDSSLSYQINICTGTEEREREKVRLKDRQMTDTY